MRVTGPRSTSAIVVVIALAAVSVLLGTPPAHACSLAGENLRAEPETVAESAQITISGSDIYYFESPLTPSCGGLATYDGPATVTLIADVGQPGTDLGSVTVADGVIEPTPLYVPAGLAAGTYQLALIIDAGANAPYTYQSRWTLTVVADPGTTTTTTSPADPAPPSAAPEFTG